MRPLLLVAAALTAALPISAQTIQGRVLENGTDRPVAQVSIELRVEGQVRARTQSYDDGSFVLVAPAPGDYQVAATRVGYESLLSNAFHLNAQDSAALVFRLTSDAVVLQPVRATSTQRRPAARLAGFYERSRRNRAGRFLTRDVIDAANASRTSDLLRRVPGLQFRPTRKGGLAVRGRGGCEPTVYIDGMDVSMYRDAVTVDDMVSPGDLEGVEVYGSAAIPVEFVRNTPGNQCGAVMFWTKMTQ
jgi:hypothetical protein